MSLAQQFRESPFGPLSQHMVEVKSCVSLVRPLAEALRVGDHAKLKELADQVFKVEHQADKIKTEIRRSIPKTFSLPVYRGDLLAYLKLQDDIADAVEDLAVIMTLKRTLRVPKPLEDEFLAYVDKVLEVCDYLFLCTDHLADLKEADFGSAKGEQILEHAAKAEHAEWEADKSAYALSQHLFDLEEELNIKATDILMLGKVIQQLGNLANHADKTAERLRRMLAR
jgi:predicted phosphate transport protein (TIGR00153 family)